VSDKEHIIVLQKQVSELLERCSILESKLSYSHKQIEALEKENTSLKAELAWYKSNQNSTNSNLPPSHDLHKPKQKAKKKKSTRNRGGQFGHTCNRLEKVDTPDEIIVHHVDVCGYCGEDLTEQPGQMVRTAQVYDIPPIEISVTEHHKISKCCPRCNQTTQSELPGTLNYSDVQYGDRLKNLVTYMSSRQYLSVNRTAEFASVLTGTNISTGFVWDTVHRKAQQCVAVYENM
jgi:transposase